MIADIFPIVNSDTRCKELLGNKPLRLFPWSYAESPLKPIRPYATYGTVNLVPENYITGVPDIDNILIQIDVWGDTVESCIECYTALRNCLQTKGNMINGQGATRDAETKLYNARLEFDIKQQR